MTCPPPIPSHRLLRRIGAGSYGGVWLAIDALGRWTAVKVVSEGVVGVRGGLEQELCGLQAYEELSSRDARLLGIRNVGRDFERGFLHYSMPLADDAGSRSPLPRLCIGEEGKAEALAQCYEPWTLRYELNQLGRLDPNECVGIGLALLEALEVLHSGGLVHRDIKPANIVFVDGRPKLADFGLVRSEDATRTSIAGTSGFVPLHGGQERSGDLYAVGKVLYMMHTGRGATEFPREASEAHSLNHAASRVHANLRAVYDRACEPDPRRRYPSADAFREELAMVFGVRPIWKIRRAERFRRRILVGALATAGLAVLTAAGLLIELRFARATHQATLTTLENRALARLRQRIGGWSSRDWAEIRDASRQRQGVEVERRAVATLSGLDARLLAHWRDVEASSAAISRDGRILIAGFGDAPASMVIGRTNRFVLPVRGPAKAAWNAAGEPVLLQAQEGNFVLRQAITGAVIWRQAWARGDRPASDGQPIMALSQEGTHAAAVILRNDQGSRVVIWEIASGDRLGGFDLEATCLEFSPDAKRLGIGFHDGSAAVIDLDSLVLGDRLPSGVAPSPVQALAFGRDQRTSMASGISRGGDLLAVGHRGTGIVIWDLARSIPRSFCRGSNWEVASLVFLPDGMTLVSGGRTGVHYWDVATGAQLLWTLENSSRTRALASNGNGSLVVSGATSESAPPDLCVWELESGRGVHHLRGLSTPVRIVTLADDACRVAALSDEWVVGVWDVRRGRLLRLFEVPAGTYADGAGIAMRGDGLQFAYAVESEVRLYDVDGGNLVGMWSLPRVRSSSNRLQFDEQGRLACSRLIAEGGNSHGMRWEVWHLGNGGEVVAAARQTDARYSAKHASLAPGRRFLFVLAEEPPPHPDSIRGVDAATGNELWRHSMGKRNVWFHPRFEPGGAWVAVPHPAMPPQWTIMRMEDGSMGRVIGHCVSLGPGAVLHGEVNPEANRGSLQWVDGSRADIPFESDSRFLSDGHVISRQGRHAAWGCVDGVVVVMDLDAVSDRLVGFRRRG